MKKSTPRNGRPRNKKKTSRLETTAEIRCLRERIKVLEAKLARYQVSPKSYDEKIQDVIKLVNNFRPEEYDPCYPQVREMQRNAYYEALLDSPYAP